MTLSSSSRLQSYSSCRINLRAVRSHSLSYTTHWASAIGLTGVVCDGTGEAYTCQADGASQFQQRVARVDMVS